MSAPFVWILLPLPAAGIFALFADRRHLVHGGSAVVAAILALCAKWLPIGKMIIIGPWSFEISPQLVLFGRRFLIEDADRPLLFFFYLLLMFWFLLCAIQAPPRKFFPLGLVSISLVLTGYAVEPVFYAALFFGFLAMVCVILLSPAGRQPTKGVLRFLAYQVLGMICILFAAWLLSWIDVESMSTPLLNRTMVLMGLGFSFFLGVFPFTSWISMLSEGNHPLLVAFVFTVYLNGVLLFGLKYVSRANWPVNTLDIQGPVRSVGLLMIVIGGLSAIFVSHLGRLMGAGVTIEIGRSLVAFSLLPDGIQIYFGLLVTQVLALGLWSVAVFSIWRRTGSLDYRRVEGAAGRHPVQAIGLFSGYMTIAGFPLWGGFPYHLSLGTMLSADQSWPVWLFLWGNAGMLLGGLRMLAVLGRSNPGENSGRVKISWRDILILSISLFLLLSGLFPHILVRYTFPLGAAFQ